MRTDARTAFLAAAALTGFAANSLLCRLALGPRLVDAATFTGVRLLSGAVVLAFLVSVRSGASRPVGSWRAAFALFAYAAAFSFAYLALPAGTGALILFGVVQATMIGWGLVGGERFRPVEWLGLGLAVSGLVALTLPGLSAPDPAGALFMAVAGLAWGVYSLLGRGTKDPLAATAGNFLRAVPMALTLLAGVTLFGAVPHATARGLVLAVVSGALASGIGYSLWYAALRHLPASRAAIAQLAVPALAAAGGVVLLAEPLTPRLVLAGAAILAGVATAVTSPSSPPR